AAIEHLGVEAERDRDTQRDHLAILERDEATHEIGGRHRHILAKSECIVLVDPGVIARLGTVLAGACKARARVLVERPPLRTMLASRGRPVERPLALAPVEARQVAARR